MNGASNPLASSSSSLPNGSRPTASASPATMAGNTPAAPSGPPRKRRPRESNPLRPPRRPLKSITRPVMSLTQFNQTRKPDNAPSAHDSGPISVDALRNEFLQRGARAVPLVVTRKDLKQLRHHVMRLHSKQVVDVLDTNQFQRPIRLHRRDPRAPPSGGGPHFEDEDTKEDLEESKERERMEMAREERRKIREENQAKIAPTGTKKPPAFQKKTEQKYRADDTPEAKKRQLLRYEETLPWHLEDFDNKQIWTGTYESEMSETHLMLTSDTANAHGQIIQLAPLERWYRFNPKTKAKSTEDPELPKIKANANGFFVKLEQKNRMKQELAEREKGAKGIRTRVGGGDDDEGRIRRRIDDDDIPIIKREADADDIDFNLEEDFADDEEGLNGLFEGDDADVKEASERLRRDMLGAAAFDLRNEDEIYRQEEQERQAQEMQRAMEKSLRKALVRREKNIDYETDNDDPYASTSSSDTDSETERQRAKEEQEKKANEQNGKAAEGDKTASGASTKGATTPSGNHRSVDINKKKRPGSPNLSDASGNESSRKKHKKKHGDGARKTSLAHLNDGKRGAGSGSDSEMTDAGKSKLKLKVRHGASPGVSPSGSRAGSPAAGVNGSRAGSPAAASSAAAKSIPTASEIYKALPAEGMTIQALITKFKDRVDKTNTALFIKLVKAVSTFDKQRSWLIPLPTMPSDDQVNLVMRGGHKGAPSKAASPA